MTSPFTGEIRMFAGSFAPVGWAFCNGQLLSISDNDVLFNLIGTTFGGDGQDTFGLPDLQCRLPIHQDGTSWVMGQAAGVETVTLTTQQIPAHTHAATASGQPAIDTSPAGAVPAAWSDNQYTAATPDDTFAPSLVGASGGSQPHENRSPYTAVSFIIALYGVYPTP